MNKITLNRINFFDYVYVIYKYRKPTEEELKFAARNNILNIYLSRGVECGIKKVIPSAFGAAKHMAEVHIDNELGNRLSNFLETEDEFKQWEKNIPEITPKELDQYQNSYVNSDLSAVNREILENKTILTYGQELFHGGRWDGLVGEIKITTRPLSTTFCPQVALREADHLDKAYNEERIDICVLKIMHDDIHAYAFGNEGNHGNEKEVLLENNLIIKKISEEKFCDDYKCYVHPNKEKIIPVYVVVLEVRK
ncbi:hypothetical protein [Gluconobacter frateurii]|uniref:Uncharacterized protein n=1 Tax=Gluconobacter frateurii NRIC 0228 TaxID=1307946 RepID=A0ABQ0QED5_9PROT|nr:hypothetical protein [Gluconobacter frateurii]GBR15603.1 hypothetical protein AA0228_2557 [Gluconobacter frateurii NRIC 0228]GLP90353.1 hypothetical protein GCM10007868_14280 [Gluconobacter frateurii]